MLMVVDEVFCDCFNVCFWCVFIGDFLLSCEDWEVFIVLYELFCDYFVGKSVEEKEIYLVKISYCDYLFKNVGFLEILVKYFQGCSNDFFVFGVDVLLVVDVYVVGFFGFDVFGLL